VPADGAAEGADQALGVLSGRDRRENDTTRRCIVSGELRPKTELLRFVAAPDGSVVLDLDGKLPGRGLWLSVRRDMVETATRKKAFARAARQGLTAAADLPDQVAFLLRRRCLDTLGFARRAGLVTAGFDKVKAEAKAGRLRMLLEASEGAADGRRKISALAPKAPVIDMFTGAELAAILGREHVVHVALLSGPPAQRALAQRLVTEIDRLRGYLGNSLSEDSEDRTEHVPALAQGRTEPTEQVPADAGLQGPSEHTDFDA
jgi:predicted RNA-binding protein YlxR (DUF448 family)